MLAMRKVVLGGLQLPIRGAATPPRIPPAATRALREIHHWMVTHQDLLPGLPDEPSAPDKAATVGSNLWISGAAAVPRSESGTLAVSLDGIHYTFVAASAILSGAYNEVVGPSCPPPGTVGQPIFTAVSTAFTNTIVNLDAACNAAAGGTGGCAGQSVRIAFIAITDCSVVNDGWFLDDVSVTACVP